MGVLTAGLPAAGKRQQAAGRSAGRAAPPHTLCRHLRAAANIAQGPLPKRSCSGAQRAYGRQPACQAVSRVPLRSDKT